MSRKHETIRGDETRRRDLGELRLRQMEYAAQARQVALLWMLRGLARLLRRIGRGAGAVVAGSGRRSSPARPAARRREACCP